MGIRIILKTAQEKFDNILKWLCLPKMEGSIFQTICFQSSGIILDLILRKCDKEGWRIAFFTFGWVGDHVKIKSFSWGNVIHDLVPASCKCKNSGTSCRSSKSFFFNIPQVF